MKNQNGLGSVFKLKGKRRKPWTVKISYRDQDNKIKRKYLGFFETKREAQKLQLEYSKNPLLFNGKTFKEIKELWWADYIKSGKKESTLRIERIKLKRFETLDNLRIADIKLYHLQELFDNMEISNTTKNTCRATLGMIFDFALKNEFISSNRVKFINIGKLEPVLERKIFTEEEIKTLWENLHIKNVCYILILIYTGLRISELLHLETNDINLIDRTLKVIDAKTSAGIRIVPISSKVFDLFKNNINHSNKYFIQIKKEKVMCYQTFKLRFNTALKKIKIQRHTIHDTRHTFATLLNNADANSTSIIKLIGHSDFKTTQNVYTHKDTEELRKAIELLQ